MVNGCRPVRTYERIVIIFFFFQGKGRPRDHPRSWGKGIVYKRKKFWYNTQHIGKLGFLEYIFVTQSQHRVHHAINPIYIDKNLSAILPFSSSV